VCGRDGGGSIARSMLAHSMFIRSMFTQRMLARGPFVPGDFILVRLGTTLRCAAIAAIWVFWRNLCAA
jgi:hypothetical protein